MNALRFVAAGLFGLLLILSAQGCSEESPPDSTDPPNPADSADATPPRTDPSPPPVVGPVGDSAFAIHDLSRTVRHEVDPADILKGVPRPNPRDAIPPIYKPTYRDVDKAGHMKGTDRVIGLVVGGEARAFPIKILDYHEIVNDTLGSVPVAITYCPLCATAVAFKRQLSGRTLTFGVSGYLYESDLLMWDHETESFWSQISGRAIAGPMTGAQLTPLVVRVTSWFAWRADHPNGLVLAPPSQTTPYDDYPYKDYRQSERTLVKVKHASKRFRKKTIVTGVQINGAYKAYPHPELKQADPLFRDTVGGEPIEIRYDAATDSCRIFDVNGHERVSLHAFWFAWYTFHPKTDIFLHDDTGAE